MSTWKQLISRELKNNKESWKSVVANTLSKEELNREFNSGYGGTEGVPFTVWTKDRVYFPVCYDGAEWVASVSRNPDELPTKHVGGG